MNQNTNRRRRRCKEKTSASTASSLDSLMQRASLNDVPSPANPAITNLNSLLSDIYVRYIALRQDDFKLHYEVFDGIFYDLHQNMKDVDPYYARYSSTLQFMGSHYDNLRIKKPDEFDMFNVIRLPSEAEKNTVIKPEEASFVFLEIKENYIQTLNKRAQGDIDRKLLQWLDARGRLTRTKVFDWFKGVVDKALKCQTQVPSEAVFTVNGEKYSVKKLETGPAVTLVIRNKMKKFRMDVDLVPAFKFSTNMWPPGPNYRPISKSSQKNSWLVVPKPDKYREGHIKKLQWRIALPEQERDLIHDSYNLRTAIRLLKKLRDTLGMTKIASYYIKQVVYWEVAKEYPSSFWTQCPADLFKLLVQRLYLAVQAKKIPYYWNKNNNLLKRVDASTLTIYENTLSKLIKVLDNPDKYMEVAGYLLTSDELKYYK